MYRSTLIRSARVDALFDFDDAVKHIEKRRKWGCSSAGRASALHAEGQEFDPPHLHHILFREYEGISERDRKHGRIAQVVRAHA